MTVAKRRPGQAPPERVVRIEESTVFRAGEAATRVVLEETLVRNGWRVLFLDAPFGPMLGPLGTKLFDAVALRARPGEPDALEMRLLRIESGTLDVPERTIERLRRAVRDLALEWMVAAFDGERMRLFPDPDLTEDGAPARPPGARRAGAAAGPEIPPPPPPPAPPARSGEPQPRARRRGRGDSAPARAVAESSRLAAGVPALDTQAPRVSAPAAPKAAAAASSPSPDVVAAPRRASGIRPAARSRSRRSRPVGSEASGAPPQAAPPARERPAGPAEPGPPLEPSLAAAADEFGGAPAAPGRSGTGEPAAAKRTRRRGKRGGRRRSSKTPAGDTA